MDLDKLSQADIFELADELFDFFNTLNRNIAIKLYRYLAERDNVFAIIELMGIFYMAKLDDSPELIALINQLIKIIDKAEPILTDIEVWPTLNINGLYQYVVETIHKPTIKKADLLIIFVKLYEHIFFSYLTKNHIQLKNEYNDLLDRCEQAANLENNDNVMLRLGHIYNDMFSEEEYCGDDCDEILVCQTKAFKLYNKSYQLGNSKAIYYLTQLYIVDHFATINHFAIALCHEAIYNNNNTYAMTILAENSQDIYDSKPNPEAIRLYQDAISNGNIISMFAFGSFCKYYNCFAEFSKDYLTYYHTAFINFNNYFDLQNYQINWHPKLHIWWPFVDCAENIAHVVNLLLISKHRNNSTIQSVNCLCKGVVMKIICEYCMINKIVSIV